MLKPLTSFRFFAALLVFISHAAISGSKLQSYYFGVIGVSFFFTLSGFILTYTYLSKFERLDSKNLASFFIARVAKIYPVHILTFILFIPLAIGRELEYHSSVPWQIFIVKSIINLSLLQSYFPTLPNSFNGVSWSISNEMFFYCALPFLLFFCNKNKGVLKSRLALVFATIVWVVLISFLFNVDANKDNEWLLYSFPPLRFFEFLIGALIGYIFARKPLTSIPSFRIFSIMEVLSLFALIIAVWVSPNFPLSIRYGMYFTPFWCFLIYIFAHQSGIISRLLSNLRLVWLGEISFSFYMTHFMILLYLEKYSSLSHWNQVLVALPFSIFVSAILYTYFEEPLRKKIRQFFILRTQKFPKDKVSSVKV